MDIKSFEGLLDGVAQAKATKGKNWSFGVKTGEDWYNYFGPKEEVVAEQKMALEAKLGQVIVKFDYKVDGKYNNIFGKGNWLGEPRSEVKAEPESDIAQCVRDARDAWARGIYGELLGELDPSDKEAIYKIAISLMINRRVK